MAAGRAGRTSRQVGCGKAEWSAGVNVTRLTEVSEELGRGKVALRNRGSFTIITARTPGSLITDRDWKTIWRSLELLHVLKRPVLMNADEQQVRWQEQSRFRPGLPAYQLSPAWNSEHNHKTQPSTIMTVTWRSSFSFIWFCILLMHS